MENIKIETPDLFCKTEEIFTKEKCSVSFKLELKDSTSIDLLKAKDIKGDTNEQKIVESIKSEIFEMPSDTFVRKNCSDVTESWKLEYAEIERSIANRSSLANHNQIHTGEKPFECETCGQKFTWKGYLESHKKLHSFLEKREKNKGTNILR